MRTEHVTYSNDIGFIWVRPGGRTVLKGVFHDRQIDAAIKKILAEEGCTEKFRVKWHRERMGVKK